MACHRLRAAPPTGEWGTITKVKVETKHNMDWHMFGIAMRHLPLLTTLDMSCESCHTALSACVCVCRMHRGVLISCRVVLCLFSCPAHVHIACSHQDP